MRLDRPRCAFRARVAATVWHLARAGFVWGSWLALAVAAEAPDTAAPPVVDYSRQIRPILSNNCFKCHGPDEKERQGGLRLDLRDDALKPTTSGAIAVVPGKPDASALLARITAVADDELMPPPGSNQRLSPREIELLRQWIDQGADYKLHWSYATPRRPALPQVTDRNWARTGIDHFILQRLERSGLKPAPEADLVTLIRRLSLDLTGLPPTLEEVDQFVEDAGPDAYQKVVDRLLASPHFGEQMAQDWLDLARYGDTNGYENDSDRSIWKYREWVIKAFNRNTPFDQFTIEQIAGDLLPGATPEQRTATGFSRNVTYNEEGGADPEEYLVKYAVDRANTTATAYLGTTMACAECHDHKYDPFSQRDYYSLLAFFNSVEGEKGAQGHDVPLPPLLAFATPEQAADQERVKTQLAELDARIQQELAQVKLEEAPSAEFAPSAKQCAVPAELREHVWIDDALPSGAAPQGNESEKSWQWGEPPGQPVSSGRLSHGRTAKGMSQHYFTGATHGLRVGDAEKLFAYVFLDPRDPPKTLMLQFNDGSWEHRAYWGENLVSWGVDRTASRRPMGPLPTVGGWVRLEIESQAIGLAPGSVVHGMAFTQVDGKVFWDKTGLLTRTAQAPLPQESLGAWEEFELGPPNPTSKLPKPVLDVLQTARDQRTDAQQAELRNHFVRYVYSKARETFDPINKQYEDLKTQEAKLAGAIPTTMVMSEMAQRRPAFVLVRGNYQTPGEEVTPNVPTILPPLAAGKPANRLGLAYWLVDPENPLTARVTVNRFWKQFFGTGLVKTLEDFGSQGEFPSHPELLDWLAVEFMQPSAGATPGAAESNAPAAWDVKRLVKLIVTSAVYRQSSNPQGGPVETDPDNRLLARGARFRMSAEAVRDNALAISGLLNRELGGKSVYPYQPADYYADKGRWKWSQSSGPDLYRRGLYTFWRRTTFYPSFQVFDAPTREFCTVDRPRTNTPLQALVTLNDPVFVEAARVFAQRIIQEGGESASQKLSFAFRLCVARAPRDKELEVLQRLYDEHLATYQADAAASLALVSNGAARRPENLPVAELAAWTAMGNVLLNLDETITRE
ncbi:MAG TPA: PSD1 and planctomycete cytochrome C domain-containing protein [Pirellulales bacterium]|nr:PSD1 and planctomycete cytochrome C domain-containing protein [Pirellulales bacterium]